MGLMPTWLAIYRLVKQLRGLFADARASRAESVKSLVFARCFHEWQQLHGSWYAIGRAGRANILWFAEKEPVALVRSDKFHSNS
jgi:hypothetical protein